MISQQSERMDIPEEFFGLKREDFFVSRDRDNIFYAIGGLIILAGIATMFAVRENLVFGSSVDGVGFGFILFGIGTLIMFVTSKVGSHFEKKSETEFVKAVDKKYAEWYYSELIPFLEKKYDLKFNAKGSAVFREGGENAKTADGRMIRVKVGGIEFEGKSVAGYFMSRTIAVPKFTFNGEVWLTEVVSSREISEKVLTPANK